MNSIALTIPTKLISFAKILYVNIQVHLDLKEGYVNSFAQIII